MEYVDWLDMLYCYLFTIASETAVLCIGLSARHGIGRKLFAGVWLSTCTYPILWIAMPAVMYPNTPRWLFMLVGETFVTAAECGLFWIAFDRRNVPRRDILRDMLTIVAANLASFLLGELWYWIQP